MVLVTALIFAGFGVLLTRLVALQVLEAEELSIRAERQHEKGMALEGERGTIYDRRGRILATTVEVPSLYAIPALVDHPAAAATELSRVLDLDRGAIQGRLEKGKNFTWIARKISPALAESVKELGLEGTGFVPESQRFYPKRFLLGHVLGFVGLDNEGLEGIELKYDSYLRGEKSLVVVERDAAGRPIFPKGLQYTAPSRGKDLVLTIDEVIQHIAERELDALIERTSAATGSVIVTDPKTGEVLAMAVRPVFNPNRVNGHEPEHWRNRTVTDPYEPGSTFKITTAAAALQEKLTTPRDLFYAENGAMVVANRTIHDHEKYGYLTFAEVFQKSSNIGTAKIAMRVGDEMLYRYIRAFGFGEKTGIDLSGESPGLIRQPQRWSDYSLASISIGQEVQVTPLQVITAYGALANGGRLMRPYLVSEIREPDGKVLAQFGPQTRRQVISPETARELVKILEGTVAPGGTGEKAAVAGFTAAGKTGTAQRIDPETRRYSDRNYVSSFVGFVPSDDPQIAILVVVDSPQGPAWGGSVVGPTFKQIAEQTLRYLGVMPRSQERLLLVAR
jgi:cell division protein FtsI (penicillin-binding protein 3)